MRPLAAVAAAFTFIAAGAALAQAADIAGAPPRQNPSREGTVTNPPVSGSAVDPNGAAATPEAPPARAAEPEGRHPDTTVRQQADAKRRQALEHCQTLTGASRIDCVKRADAEFRRATSDDTLSDRGPDPFYG